jgi:hypothetical protein
LLIGLGRALRKLEERARGLEPGAQGLAALIGYALLSVGLYGLPVLGRFSSTFVGTWWHDPRLFSWSLVWWPHALSTGENPLHTDLLWASTGVNLAWVTTIPGPSVLMWPVTEAFGPIVSLNLLQLAAPALGGWATFLVCRRVTGAFWPSLAGGYFFGFSTYLLNHMTGHPNLTLVFPVPLAVYLVVRRVQDDIHPVIFVAAMAADLTLLFSIFTETFATLAVFGSVALAGALAATGREMRLRLLGTIGLIALAYAVAAAVVLPYVLATLRDVPARQLASLETGSVDLMSFVVPRRTALVGGDAFRDITDRFTAPVVGDGGYLGIPLIAIALSSAAAAWRRRSTWFLMGLAVVLAVVALGPVLHVAGRETIELPWRLVETLPLINHAVPDRFTMYLWLVTGIIVAVWLGARPRSPARWALVLVAAIAIAPDLSALPYHVEARLPPFFSQGLYRRYLEPGEVVLVLPLSRQRPGLSAHDMYWQAETDMYFRLATGYTAGFVPAGNRARMVRCLRQDRPELVRPRAFVDYILQQGVETVIVSPGYAKRWRPLLSLLEVDPVEVGGLTLYELAGPGSLPPSASLSRDVLGSPTPGVATSCG